MTLRSDSPFLMDEEFVAFRSVIWKCNWFGREVRPKPQQPACSHPDFPQPRSGMYGL